MQPRRPPLRRLEDARLPWWRRLFWSRKRWALAEPWGFVADDRFVVVPEGFETDLGTIPRPFWWYVSPTYKRALAAYVAHDWLLSEGVAPSYANRVFYDTLRAHGVGETKALAMFAAVEKWH